MSLSIGSNYSNSFGSYSGSSGVKRVQGFDETKIQSIKIKADDMKKYGIDKADFFKVDVDEDGTIDASEFLSAGIGIASIFNAYKAQAGSIEGAYSAQELQQSEEPQNQFMNNNMFNTNPMNKNSLSHPSMANHPFLAKNMDISV